MSGDVFFKTMTFGGFNKDDVLEYIRGQQEQLAGSQKALKENEDKLLQEKKRAADLEAQLLQQQAKAEEYFSLSEEYAKKIFALEDEVNELNSKISSIEVGCERAKDVEGQIGALVLDALLYSDKIIQSARAAAKGVSSQTKQTIEEAVNGVGEIGDDITQISDNFGVVVASLVSKINSLSSNLTSVADKLDAEEERIDKEQFTFGENGEVHLPTLTENDFGMPEDDGVEISDDEIKNLVDILEGSLHRDIHDVETPEETEKSSEKMTDEEIAELTRRFLEGAD